VGGDRDGSGKETLEDDDQERSLDDS